MRLYIEGFYGNPNKGSLRQKLPVADYPNLKIFAMTRHKKWCDGFFEKNFLLFKRDRFKSIVILRNRRR